MGTKIPILRRKLGAIGHIGSYPGPKAEWCPNYYIVPLWPGPGAHRRSLPIVLTSRRIPKISGSTKISVSAGVGSVGRETPEFVLKMLATQNACPSADTMTE